MGADRALGLAGLERLALQLPSAVHLGRQIFQPEPEVRGGEDRRQRLPEGALRGRTCREPICLELTVALQLLGRRWASEGAPEEGGQGGEGASRGQGAVGDSRVDRHAHGDIRPLQPLPVNEERRAVGVEAVLGDQLRRHERRDVQVDGEEVLEGVGELVPGEATRRLLAGRATAREGLALDHVQKGEGRPAVLLVQATAPAGTHGRRHRVGLDHGPGPAPLEEVLGDLFRGDEAADVEAGFCLRAIVAFHAQQLDDLLVRRVQVVPRDGEVCGAERGQRRRGGVGGHPPDHDRDEE